MACWWITGWFPSSNRSLTQVTVCFHGRRPMTTRRAFLASSPVLGLQTARLFADATFTSQRPPLEQRKFTSPAVESRIDEIKKTIADPELGWMFENCFPNTLDTTVRAGELDGKPDTFVITGDIDAM